MTYYHLSRTEQKRLDREYERSLQQQGLPTAPKRCDSWSFTYGNRFDAQVKKAYESNWKTSEGQSQQPKNHRSDGSRVSLKSYYENNWKR